MSSVSHSEITGNEQEERASSSSETDQKEINTAMIAETLFLANLLLIPVIPFLALLYLYQKYADKPDSLAFNHLRQTLIASVFSGIFIVVIIGIFYFMSNLSAAITWTIIITYLTCVHSLFVMMGIYGLSKAMVGQVVKFPLISSM